MKYAISALLAVLPAFFSVGEENAAPADVLAGRKLDVEIPTAPEGYRRPENWRPVLYPRGLAELAREESSNHIARAKALMRKVDAVNAAGKWKPTGESMDEHVCPEWFVDAKLGIFIDWGPWSLASWCPYVKGVNLYPDWYELRCHSQSDHIAYHEKNWGEDFKRDHFLDLFRARKFDAPRLMRLFKDCGAKYVVPFLKHHAGFCLWDSSFTFRDCVDQGPRRDLAREMADACRAEGLKFGFYNSQAGEWEYPILQKDGSIKMYVEANPELKPYTPDMEWKASGKVAVRDFVREYIVPQAVEFIDKYDPDIFWGDYDWATDATENGSYDIVAYFYNRAEGRKEVAVNDRLGNGTPEEVAGKFPKHPGRRQLRTLRGDFYTDESGDTAAHLDKTGGHPWEECTGISLAYGNHWQANNAESVLSEREFICLFSGIVSRGGNLLLLVNLDPQGEIPAVQRERLLQIGAWLKKNGEAIYATRLCAPFHTDDVDYTRSKDGRISYAIVKRPKRVLELECALPDGTVVTELETGRRLGFTRVNGRSKVALPDDLLVRNLPFVLKCDSGVR